MVKPIHGRNMILLFLAAFMIAAVIYAGVGYYSGLAPNFGWFDGALRWKESQYVLEGINPFDMAYLSLDDFSSIKEMGALPAFAGNLPWVYILSNAVLPGFIFSWPVAKLVSMILYGLIAAISAVCLYQYLLRFLHKRGIEDHKNRIALMCVSCFFAQMAVLSALKWGNHAFVVNACLIIFITLDHDKNFLLSGLVLALAMLKPQVSFLFFIPLLLKKQWKPILTAAVIVVAASLGAAFLVRENPIGMLTQMYAQGIDYKDAGQSAIYYGLFDFLTVFNVSPQIFMPPQMLLGIIATFFLCNRYKNSPSIVL